MISQQERPSLLLQLTKHLPLLEKVLWTALGVGIILTVLQIDKTVTMVALLSLGGTFFLYTYRPTDLPNHDGEPMGFPELLGLMIVPKVLWISASVSVVGITFYILELVGYSKMLLVGGLTGVIGTLLLVIFLVMGIKHIRTVLPILLRVLPLSLVDLYILLK